MTGSVAAMAWKTRVCYEDTEVALVGLLTEELLNLLLVVLLLKERLTTLQRCAGQGPEGGRVVSLLLDLLLVCRSRWGNSFQV